MTIHRILHVEDNPGDAQLLCTAVEECPAPLRIEGATNGVRTIEYLHQCHTAGGMTLPDLILLDLNMPVMGGKAFLRVLNRHENWKRIPVLVLTSSDQDEDRRSVLALEASDFVTKPAEYSDYLSFVQHLVHFEPSTEGPPGTTH